MSPLSTWEEIVLGLRWKVCRRYWSYGKFAALVVVCGLCAGSPGTAVAAGGHEFSGEFGSTGSAPGQFQTPSGVAVNEETGSVYVVDQSNNRVEIFDSTGSTLLGEFDGAAAPTGALSSPEGIAVDNSENPLDPSAGDVYVVDFGHQVLDKFSSSGVYLGQITGDSNGPFNELEGVAVDPAGTVWIYQRDSTGTGEIDSFSNGEVNEQTSSRLSPFGASSGFAVNSIGDLYVNRGGRVFAKLDIGGNTLSEEVDSEESTAAAVDLFSDDVYIDNVTSVGEFAANGAAVDRFGATHLTAGSGMAIDSSTNTVYVADSSANVVAIFTGPVLPAVTTDEASAGAAEGDETLNGTVNPRGIPLTVCEFEYGIEETYGQSAPCATTPLGSTSTPVEADITGLTPGTVYHYRLVVANANGSQPGRDRTFFAAERPLTSDEFASEVTANSAVLHTQVNPGSLATTYRFEYGPSLSYGASVPVPDGQIAAGTSNVTVLAQLTGLSANTTYHWRIQATNADGTAASPDHTFIYDTTTEGLPDNRRYEMVTPSNKNGAVIGALFLGNIPPQISEDGSSVISPSIQCFAGSGSCVGSRQSEGEPFEFVRTSSSWTTVPLAPPISSFETNSVYAYNPNSHTALFSSPAPPTGGDHFYARQPDGSFTDIGPIGEGETGFNVVKLISASTADLSHLVYATFGPVWSFDSTQEGLHEALYEYVGFGSPHPTMVAVSGGAGSTDLISTCGSTIGSLSADGRMLYFVTGPCESGSGANAEVPVPTARVYARIDESRTILISTPTPATCATPACQNSEPLDALFERASTDGTRVFFRSAQQLTDDAVEGGLYESECPDHCEDPSQRHLIDVTAHVQGSGGPQLQGVLAISPDGSHVYFVSEATLTTTPNGQSQVAKEGDENLYAYERDASHPEGHLTFVAALAESDKLEWAEGASSQFANVTPDGRFLVFTSHRGLTADATRSEGPSQVYRYDAETGELIRISIGEHGYNDNGNAGTGNASIVQARNAFALGSGPGRTDPTMSHDGSYVFFQNPVALTPNALDDVPTVGGKGVLAQNVYEYHEGHVYLLSDGKDVSEANKIINGAVELLGSDATGENVFFATNDPLTSQDTDTQRDYYDAHICSESSPCISPPPVPGPPCREDDCHTPASTTTPPPPIGSTTIKGSGNLPTLPSPTPIRVKLLKRTLNTVHPLLSLRVSSKGQLTITGNGIRKARHATAKAGAYGLRLTLTSAARRRLRRLHKLKLVLHIVARSADGATTNIRTTITIKR